MNYRAQIAALLPHTMEFLGVYQGMSTGEIRKQDGVDDRFARIMHDLARTYYGKTHATRQQAKARQQTIAMGHTWETLRAIGSCVNKLNNKDHAWQVRVELTRSVAHCRTVRAAAVAVLVRFNSMQATNPKNSLTEKPISGTTKMRITIVVDQHLGRTAIDRARAQGGDAAVNFVTAAVGGTGELPAVEPVVVLPADTSTMGATEHELYNYMLSLSDGTSVTALEWAQMKLAEFGWVLVLDPVTGKELGFFRFRTADARFAGPLERKIQRAKTPVCAVEGCACGRISARCTTVNPG